MDCFENRGFTRTISTVNVGNGVARLEFKKRVISEIGDADGVESQASPVCSIVDPDRHDQNDQIILAGFMWRLKQNSSGRVAHLD